MLEIKGQVLHRVRLHVKVPGWLLNLNALLTKSLPTFLSRFNEMSGGRENMCLVSGSLQRILKFYHGNTESRKNLEQKSIFQLGTLSPHGINERLSFH